MLNVKSVLSDAWSDANRDPIMAVWAFLLGSVPSLIATFTLDFRQQLSVISFTGTVLLVLQVVAIRRSLDRKGLRTVHHSPPRGYFWRVFWQGIPVTIIVLIGFLLLILPGLIALSLFAISIPVLIAQDKGAMESLRVSVEMVRPHLWQALGLVVLCFSPVLLALLIYFLFVPEEGPPIFWLELQNEAARWLSMIAWWYVQTAIYVALVQSSRNSDSDIVPF